MGSTLSTVATSVSSITVKANRALPGNRSRGLIASKHRVRSAVATRQPPRRQIRPAHRVGRVAQEEMQVPRQRDVSLTFQQTDQGMIACGTQDRVTRRSDRCALDTAEQRQAHVSAGRCKQDVGDCRDAKPSQARITRLAWPEENRDALEMFGVVHRKEKVSWVSAEA